MMAWNVFVESYGARHYSFEKIDNMWVLLSLVVFIALLVAHVRTRKLVIYKKSFYWLR